MKEYTNKDFPFEDESIDFRKYFFLFISNWYWIVIGLITTFILAWTYLRYVTPVYQASCLIMINDEEQESYSEEMVLADLGFIGIK